MDSPNTIDERIKQEFERKLSRLSGSRAYLDYCEAVTGYRLPLFNMLDRAQIDVLIHRIPISSGDTVLDLGCGDGSLLRTLIRAHGCQGVGLDLLDSAMVKQGFQYIRGDFDQPLPPALRPTVTLMVDSLYFSRDPAALLRNLRAMEHNRIYLFFSQYLFGTEAEAGIGLRPDETSAAQTLRQCNMKYRTIDFSQNERALYERSLSSLRMLEHAFRQEKNEELFNEKVKEQQLGKQLYDAGRASRFLYVIE